MSDQFDSKKVFTKQEVDFLLKQMKIEYENNLAEQKDRIFSLVDENEKLKKDIKHFEQKDKQISDALINAVSKAKEIEDTANKRFKLEIARLKIFQNKWSKYYNAIKKKYPLDSDLMQVEQFLLKMDDLLDCDYMSSPERVYVKPEKRMFKAISGDVVMSNDDGYIPPNDSGFDFNEALNPTQDLADLCRELGLMNEGDND